MKGVFIFLIKHPKNPKKISDKIFSLSLLTFVKDEILTIQKNKIKSKNKEYAFEHLLITAGAFSKQFTDQLGETIPLETERGYHVHFKDCDHLLKRPGMFVRFWDLSYSYGARIKSGGDSGVGRVKQSTKPKTNTVCYRGN